MKMVATTLLALLVPAALVGAAPVRRDDSLRSFSSYLLTATVPRTHVDIHAYDVGKTVDPTVSV